MPEGGGWTGVLGYQAELFTAAEVRGLADDLLRAVRELARAGTLGEDAAAVLARLQGTR
ncbi:hypothetical protein [Actinomadura keratinilytica]